MSKEKKYFLYSRSKRVAVSQKIYKAYFKMLEQEKYQNKVAQENEQPLSELTDGKDKKEYEYILSLLSLEDEVAHQHLIAKLPLALALLDSEDFTLITGYFYQKKTERQLAQDYGVSQPAIHKRKTKILENLRNILEN